MAEWDRNFHLQLLSQYGSHTIVWADPSLRCTSMLLGSKATNKQQLPLPCLSWLSLHNVLTSPRWSITFLVSFSLGAKKLFSYLVADHLRFGKQMEKWENNLRPFVFSKVSITHSVFPDNRPLWLLDFQVSFAKCNCKKLGWLLIFKLFCLYQAKSLTGCVSHPTGSKYQILLLNRKTPCCHVDFAWEAMRKYLPMLLIWITTTHHLDGLSVNSSNSNAGGTGFSPRVSHTND